MVVRYLYTGLGSGSHAGFSLIELLTVIAICAILLALGSHFFDDIASRYKVKQEISQIQLLLANARTAALFSNSKVSLCPLDAQLKCSNDWNQKLTLFTDHNHNRTLDNNDTVLQVFPAVNQNKALRHFNNLAVGFNAHGFAGYNTGSLSVCYKGRTTIGAVFIISRNGRVRHAKAFSPKPLPKTAGGKPIPCPT